MGIVITHTTLRLNRHHNRNIFVVPAENPRAVGRPNFFRYPEHVRGFTDVDWCELFCHSPNSCRPEACLVGHYLTSSELTSHLAPHRSPQRSLISPGKTSSPFGRVLHDMRSGWQGRSLVRTKPDRVADFPQHAAEDGDVEVRIVVDPHDGLGDIAYHFGLELSYQQLFSPLVGSIAAGGCAILKPSQESPQTAACVARLGGAFFPEGYAAVVLGGRDQTQAIIAEEVDFVFFTGSPRWGG